VARRHLDDARLRLPDRRHPPAQQRRRAQRRHDVRPGIIDTLSDGNLNGGAQVAGTGTIDAAGTVGPIGGIRQKMYGAVGAGATYFLAPRDNCDEVVGHVPSGLRVFSVATLKDSLQVLSTIRDKGDLDALPTCR
jgi:PDZ domain-containing protein